MASQIHSGGSGKAKISTTIHEETRTVSENGMTETEVTKIITDHFSDGTTSTRKETRTTHEEEITADGMVRKPETALPPSTMGHSYQSPPPAIAPPPPQNHQDNRAYAMNTSSGYQTSSPPPVVSAAPTYAPAPAPPKPQPQPENTDGAFIEEALLCHNKYRRKHNVPPLTVSLDLCRVAQNWANQLAQKGVMENSHYGYGENIYWSSAPGHVMIGDIPVEYWYREEAQYDWSKMDFQKNTGSFTQLIWKDSRQFGMAKGTGQKGTFIVAFYSPPGNVLGQFRENVFRALY